MNAFVVDQLAGWHVKRGFYARQHWEQLDISESESFVRNAHAWSSLDGPQVFAFRSFGLRVEYARALDGQQTIHWAMRLELGVPFRCVQIDVKQVGQPGFVSLNLVPAHLRSVGIPAPRSLAGPVNSGGPMSPWIWWGVLLNSVFYALPFAGVWYAGKAGVRQTRRLARRRRGRCPGCGYDVREFERCPECGEATS